MTTFTIITPVYNGFDFIAETIDSVLTVCADFNFEYIVVNDGSTDKTEEILSKYSTKIKIINQNNQGEAAGVNCGLNMGSGEYVIVVSADDPMRSSTLLKQAAEILDSDSSIVCVYPDWSVLDTDSKVVRDVIVSEYTEIALVGESNCVVGPGGVFRRRNALQISGRNIRYRFTSDYDFWLRLSRTGNFQRIPGFLAYWREHEASTSIAFRGLEMANERIEVIETFLRNNSDLPEALKKMAIGHAYYQAALLVYFDRKIPGKKWLFKALMAYPAGIKKFKMKIMLYITLSPFSRYIVSGLQENGYFRNLLKNA